MSVVGRLEAALRVTAEWQAAETVDELARRACDDLLDLIPADGAAWNEIDGESGALGVVASPADYLLEATADRLPRLLHQNPLIEALPRTGGRACTFSEVVSVRDYHRRAIYGEVYASLRVEDQLGAVVSLTGGTTVAIALNRDRRSFTRAERDLMELLRGHATASYRAIAARREAWARIEVLERGLDEAGAAIAFLAADGSIADASERARGLLAAWCGGEAPAPGRYERGDAILLVRRVDGDPPLLLLDERRLAPDPARVRALGLTRREGEVVSLAGRGLTDAAIAAELFLSVRTVQKHLQNAFAKLGSHNRAGAARRLLEPD